MSYCRWSECDVYAYDSDEGVRFHVAGNQSLDRLCSTYNEAYQYAKELHDIHKLDVPRHALYALMEDAVEEAKRFTGPNSAISELTAENAKLRDENDKLRKLFSSYWKAVHCPATPTVPRDYLAEMRKLGVEVG